MKEMEINAYRASGKMEEHILKHRQMKIEDSERKIKIERARLEKLSYRPTINRFAIGICNRTIRELTKEMNEQIKCLQEER